MLSTCLRMLVLNDFYITIDKIIGEEFIGEGGYNT